FMDVDRGYFPRNGLINRRYDPRPAGLALAALNAVFNEPGPASVERIDGPADSRLCRFRAGSQEYELAYGPASALRGHASATPRKRVIDLLAQEALEGEEAWARRDRP